MPGVTDRVAIRFRTLVLPTGVRRRGSRPRRKTRTAASASQPPWPAGQGRSRPSAARSRPTRQPTSERTSPLTLLGAGCSAAPPAPTSASRSAAVDELALRA
jgi:hypothetical protein